MSGKGDNEQFTLEKVRSTYTSLTVENCSSNSKSNTVPSTASAASSGSTKTCNQQTVVTSADDRNIDITHVQMKHATDRKKLVFFLFGRINTYVTC